MASVKIHSQRDFDDYIWFSLQDGVMDNIKSALFERFGSDKLPTCIHVVDQGLVYNLNAEGTAYDQIDEAAGDYSSKRTKY